MTTKSKRLRIIVILLLISVSFCAQDTIYRICGTWRNPYDTEYYYERNGDFIKWNTKLANDCGKHIFYYDGTGIFLYSNRIDKYEFTWGLKKDSFIYHKDVACPWYDTYKYELSYGNKYDTLRLIQTYKRKKWHYIENFFRKRIKMKEANNYNSMKIFKEDDYFIYKNRIISNQKPWLTTGHFDDENSILYLHWLDFACLKQASMLDVVEIFVFDAFDNNKLSSFIIEYDSITDSIKNIFQTNKYNIKRCYNKRKNIIVYKTYNKKKKKYCRY